EQDLLQSYLSDFRFDNALFETEQYRFGLSWSLSRVTVNLNLSDVEEVKRFGEASGLIAVPDVISTRSGSLSAQIPITGRLGMGLGFEIRKPTMSTLILERELEEHRYDLNFTWTVEPMLRAYCNIDYYDVTVRSDESLISIRAQDFDRWRFTLGMRYNFQ
ncbi:MAG: hypothetical protein P8077_09355, partial [Gammaproteobacteria bacterium]